MARKRHSDDAAFGSDSFLDVVANMVGILIILVMVVGLRLRNSGLAQVERPANSRQQAELAGLTQEEAALSEVVRTLELRRQELAAVAAARSAERNDLQVAVNLAEQNLQSAQAHLDSAGQAAFELEQTAAARERLLAELQAALQSLGSQEETTVEVVSYQTPLSQSVLQNEVHFQLRGGRIAWIPMDELVVLFKQHAQDRAYRLRDQPVLTETIGPLDGWRLRYTLDRVNVAMEENGMPAMGSFARLQQFQLIPTSHDLGELVAEALQSRSQFRSALTDVSPERTTVTLWVYPDGFADFQQVKHELTRLGFGVAARPLPEGLLIGGSPNGSRSSAQ